MTTISRVFAATGLLLLGALVGGFVVDGWHRPVHELPPARLEATVFLPVDDNAGVPFPDNVWNEALATLVGPFGGATLGPTVEGCWHDGKRIQRETVRPVVVSFEPARLGEFRKAMEAAGRRLGQQAVYARFEEPRVELRDVPVKEP